MDMLICAAVKHQTKASGMVIKNQNALYFPACSSCCRQALHFLDGENLFRVDTGISTRGRKAKQVWRIFDGPDDARRERHRPTVKVSPFHNPTLWQIGTSQPWRVGGILSSYPRGDH